MTRFISFGGLGFRPLHSGLTHSWLAEGIPETFDTVRKCLREFAYKGMVAPAFGIVFCDALGALFPGFGLSLR